MQMTKLRRQTELITVIKIVDCYRGRVEPAVPSARGGPRVPGSLIHVDPIRNLIKGPVAGVAIGYRQAPLYDDSLAFYRKRIAFRDRSHAKKFLEPSTAAPRFFVDGQLGTFGSSNLTPGAEKVKPFSTRLLRAKQGLFRVRVCSYVTM